MPQSKTEKMLNPTAFENMSPRAIEALMTSPGHVPFTFEEPGLLGSSVTVTYGTETWFSGIVTDAIEFSAGTNFLFDIQDDRISAVFAVGDQIGTYRDDIHLVFNDLEAPIESVTLLETDAGLASSGVTFDEDEIWIDTSGLPQITGTSFLLDVDLA